LEKGIQWRGNGGKSSNGRRGDPYKKYGACRTNYFNARIWEIFYPCIPHCKKGLVIFPSLARMSLTKLSLAGHPSRDILAGDGKIANVFNSAAVVHPKFSSKLYALKYTVGIYCNFLLEYTMD
jgi:hypothetical protein